MLPVADQAAGIPRPRCELADIFREYGEEYRRNHSLPVSHLRVMRAVERCRTVALGGHERLRQEDERDHTKRTPGRGTG